MCKWWWYGRAQISVCRYEIMCIWGNKIKCRSKGDDDDDSIEKCSTLLLRLLLSLITHEHFSNLLCHFPSLKPICISHTLSMFFLNEFMHGIFLVRLCWKIKQTRKSWKISICDDGDFYTCTCIPLTSHLLCLMQPRFFYYSSFKVIRIVIEHNLHLLMCRN